MLRAEAAQTHASEWRRIAAKTALVASGLAAAVGAVAGIDAYVNWSERGTDFVTAQQAHNALAHNVARDGDNNDRYSDRQDGMERDLRGAIPLLMDDIATKIVSANAIGGNYLLSDGRTVDVHTTPLEEGGEIIGVRIEDTAENSVETFRLSRHEDGSFNQFSLMTDTIDRTKDSGGTFITYDFANNDFALGSTYTQYDDQGNSLNDLGSALIVNNTYFSTYTPAGPATEWALTQFDRITATLDEVAAAPRK